MATDSSDSSSGQKASRTSAYLRALKVPAIFLLVGIGLIAAYYSVYVRNSLEYLQGRNLRLLSTMGLRIQASLDDHEKVLSSFSNYYRGHDFAEQFRCIVSETAGTIAMFAYVTPDLPAGTNQSKPHCSNSAAKVRVDTNDTPPVVRARFIDDAGTAWTRSGGISPPPPPGSVASFRVDLSRLLAPIFSRQVGEDAFDSLVLVTPSGRVIYPEGASDVRLTSLDGILRRQPDGTWKEQPFAGLGRTSQVLDVQISGGQYVLYLQPCCTNLSDVPHVEKEPGWVVAGLTDSSKLRNSSLAVSFSVMAFTGGLILLAIFSWPFLKLTLIGQEQRLRLIDVLVVGICSLLGIALVTLFVVDWYSYDRIKEDLDGQLKQLSQGIQDNVGDEISYAYDQIRILDKWTASPNPPERLSNLFTSGWLGKREDAAYPFFESFALIDTDGMQRHKLATAAFTTPLVPTNHREYFQHWLGHGVPPEQTPLPALPIVRANNAYSHTFLESIRSATTGRKEAVLSTPTETHTVDRGIKKITVEALTISMLSLNDVALPPGFKFAVIDNNGKVLFHSDPRHNLDEQFFLETDLSRRLRSSISARHDEELNVRYFGQDYRAYVAPLPVLNGSAWSLVTLFDRQLLRTVNIEWLVTTMLFTVIYASLYIVLCIVVLLFRPAYRAPWLWPDSGKRQEYQHLIAGYGVFGIAFVIAVFGLRGPHLLAIAWILPFIAWMTTYLTLTRDQVPIAKRRGLLTAGGLALSLLLFRLIVGEGPLGAIVAVIVAAGVLLSLVQVGPKVPGPYTTAAMLLLVLTAVLPTLAFFEVAHTIQVDSYLKYGQLTLARQVQHRLELAGPAAQIENQPRALERRWSRYGRFFYGSEVVDATETPQAIADTCGQDAARPDADRQDPLHELPKMLEDLLPYYSESSVGMRELLHDRSSDKAWDWHRAGARLVLHTPPNAGWNIACVHSQLPTFDEAAFGSTGTAGRVAQLVALGSLVLFAVFWIVRFTTRRIFLIDVIEPLWARFAATIPVHPGEHLYIVWRSADRNARALVEDGMYVVDLEKVTDPVEEWFAAQRDRLEQLPTGQTVVIDHLETRTGNAAFDAYKLALARDALDVQHRTVVLVSTVRPSSLVARIANASAADNTTLERRWTSLLARFTVLDGVRFDGPAVQPATVTAVAAVAAIADPAGGVSQGVARAPAKALDQTSELDAYNQDPDPVVGSVWSEVSRLARKEMPQTPLGREQIFEEVGDRLDNYHRGIWENCSDAQKLVLQHLAKEGLINEKSRRTVRLLLARRLIRKNPNFRFVNETFRRFVLSRIPAAEVAAIEQRSTSAWDAVRLPFLITLLAVSAFFFLTQRELFTTTIAVITALAGGIPALVRVAGLFEGKPGRATPE